MSGVYKGTKMIHKDGVTGTNPDEVLLDEESKKNPDLEKSDDVYKDSLTRLKEARALKKEKKKAVKAVVAKFGDIKLAKKLVKSAVGNLQSRVRRTAGRGR